MIKKGISFLFLVTMLLHVVWAKDQTYLSVFERASKFELHEAYENAIPQLLKLGQAPDRFDLNSILSVWMFDEAAFNNLELIWWKSQNPSVRVLIVGLFLSQVDEDLSISPQFDSYSNRFSVREKNARIIEIRYVRENLSSIKTFLANFQRN